MDLSHTRTIDTASVSHSAASELLAAAIRAAAEAGIDIAVAVVDAGGALKSFARTDGAPFLTVDVAINKAWTAASYGYSTHVWNDYIADAKVKPLAYLPRMMAVGGGYPLLEGRKLAGGIGISGGNYAQDQEIAVRALEEVGFQVP